MDGALNALRKSNNVEVSVTRRPLSFLVEHNQAAPKRGVTLNSGNPRPHVVRRSEDIVSQQLWDFSLGVALKSRQILITAFPSRHVFPLRDPSRRSLVNEWMEPVYDGLWRDPRSEF
ncbi:MAG: hypothetical protein RXS23_05300 [Metallosphaera yellowstonensis]